jgi:hypothetical protein
MLDTPHDLIVCACNSPQHQLVVTGWHYKQEPSEVIVTIHLSQLSWQQRVRYAIRYVLGLDCAKIGAFEEILLMPKQAKQLVSAINKHLDQQGTQS